MTSPLPLPASLPQRLLALLLGGLLWLSLQAPVRADPGRFLASPSTAELQAELQALQSSAAATSTPESRERLDDLTRLASAIARSDDRAQLHNDSRHNVGVFLRNKKDPSGTPAPFTVLGPGQETDDDYELVGFYVGLAEKPRPTALQLIPAGISF